MNFSGKIQSKKQEKLKKAKQQIPGEELSLIRNMIYQKFLEIIKKKKECPFCEINKKFIIKENKTAYLTLARAPYTKNHLLVIPKRHITQFHELKKREKSDLLDLMIYSLDRIRKKYPAIETIYKEGEIISAHKTIPHSHIHLIPMKKSSKAKKDMRILLDEKELEKGIKDIRKLFR